MVRLRVAWRSSTSNQASPIRMRTSSASIAATAPILDAYVFESRAQVRALTERWLVTYNQERPHDSLGRVPPLTFLPRPTSAGQSPFGWST